jgi:hypothetical protein
MKMLRSFAGLAALAILAAPSCNSRPPAAAAAPKPPYTLADEERIRTKAADLFTKRYAASRLGNWHIVARAAGPRCGVLFVQTQIILEDSMVEAMHYGTGPYAVYEGGVQHFFRERSFRGVAYRDLTGKLWTFGAVSPAEAESLAPCH